MEKFLTSLVKMKMQRRRPPSGAGPGGSQGGRAPRPPPRLTPPRPSPHPTPPHPTPPHARSAAGMPGRLLRVQGPGSRKPRGPPGRARRVLAGGGGVRGAERRRPAARPPGLRSRVVQLKCSARSVESCGRLGRAAGRSERQAQRRALRAPGGSRPRLRPYHPERAGSHLISEVRQILNHRVIRGSLLSLFSCLGPLCILSS